MQPVLCEIIHPIILPKKAIFSEKMAKKLLGEHEQFFRRQIYAKVEYNLFYHKLDAKIFSC